MHENRETSGASRSDQDRDRLAKAQSHNTNMHAPEESDCAVVCAEQRIDREGSSPSGARMRSAVSKSGGNASLAGRSEGMQRPKRARRRKPDTEGEFRISGVYDPQEAQYFAESTQAFHAAMAVAKGNETAP